MKWHIYFVSDGTGITAEALGYSLLTQFPDLDYHASTRPFIKNEHKLQKLSEELAQIRKNGDKTLIFSTLIDDAQRYELAQHCDAFYDLFETFTPKLTSTFGMESTNRIGLTHSVNDEHQYQSRINAVNYALLCDDGNGLNHYEDADVIIIGVSRSGKTPTSLYISMTFGVYAANYPLDDEELASHRLPDILKQHKKKLFGLTISPERLQAIRAERRPNSDYALLKTCRKEIDDLEHIYRQEKLPFVDATTHSVEEIASKILAKLRLKRKNF